MNRTAIAFGLAALLTMPAGAVQEQQGQQQEQSRHPRITSTLVGIYKITSGREGGEALSEERLSGKVLITDERITLFDDQDRELYLIRYRLQGQEAPYKMDMEILGSTNPDDVGSTAKGLVKAGKNKVTLVYVSNSETYPENFKAKGEDQHRFVLKETVRSKLVGTYAIESGRTRGKEFSEEQLQGKVVITPNQIISYDKEDRELYSASYRLTSPSEPYKVMLRTLTSTQPEAVGSVARGLLKREGKTVTLIYDYKPGDDYPDDFQAETETENLFVLKRTGDASRP